METNQTIKKTEGVCINKLLAIYQIALYKHLI